MVLFISRKNGNCWASIGLRNWIEGVIQLHLPWYYDGKGKVEAKRLVELTSLIHNHLKLPGFS